MQRDDEQSEKRSSRKSKAKDGHSWLHEGEVNAGSTHKAANIEEHGKGSDGSLDICIRVEMDQHDKEGHTRGYGMTVPALTAIPKQNGAMARNGLTTADGSHTSSIVPDR